MSKIDPALNVDCPECGVRAGQPCISYRAVSIHWARKQALANLERQADRILRRGRI